MQRRLQLKNLSDQARLHFDRESCVLRRAAVALPDLVQLILESLLFLGIGAGLVATGFGVVAGIGVGIWLLDRIAIFVLSAA